MTIRECLRHTFIDSPRKQGILLLKGFGSDKYKVLKLPAINQPVLAIRLCEYWSKMISRRRFLISRHYTKKPQNQVSSVWPD